MSTIFLCHSKDCNAAVTAEFMDAAFKNLPIMTYPVYLTTENADWLFNGLITNIKTGDGLWSERLRKALSQIDDSVDQIILFLEDMIVKNCNEGLMNQVVDFHISNQNDLTKFGTHPFFSLMDTGDDIGGYRILRQVGMPYILSHQPVSIWKREFLERVIQDDVTPWDHECVTGQKLVYGEYGDYNVFCVGHYPAIQQPVGGDYGEIIEYHHLLTRGQRIQYIGKY